MKLNDALTDARITDASPAERQYKMADGQGLGILVCPNGGKYWRFRYRFDGKQKDLALGVFPDVSLKEARKQRDHARKLLTLGVDPGIAHKEERAQAREAQKDAYDKARDEAARRVAATRFLLDNEGALFFLLGKRSVFLTPAETAELRAFLNATQEVKSHAID